MTDEDSTSVEGIAARHAGEAKPLAPGLYLVATPIGNLEDITLRALRVLESVDRVACEDTRQTAKLLSHYGIRTQTVSYHLHNEAARAAELIGALKEGARIAVVSDAGTPGIADPGALLAQEAIAAGVAVYALPGANAAVTALVASGLSTERFAFYGFLPSRAGERRTALERLKAAMSSSELMTHVFYETPHRILDCLDDIAAVFGAAHRVALARELTKLHEEHLRGTVAEVRSALAARAAVRGEMVLLIDGVLAGADEQSAAPLSLADEMQGLLKQGISEKDALKQVAKSRGLGKSDAYREWQRVKR